MGRPQSKKVNAEAYRIAVLAMRLGVHVVAVWPDIPDALDPTAVDLEVGGQLVRCNMATINKLTRWQKHNVLGRHMLSWTGVHGKPLPRPVRR